VLALIDTDPGIDDALALLFAWGSPELQLAGITTVAGNVTLADATRNVFRLLALRGVTPWPPVAAGAAGPLGRPLVTATRYHGADGLGELDDWPPVPAVRRRRARRPSSPTRCGGRPSRSPWWRWGPSPTSPSPWRATPGRCAGWPGWW
jgi:inosine-uridine nucleoside N-ribohydrolase